MFVESEVSLEILTLVKVASRDLNCSICLTDFSLNWLKENDFWLDWDVTEVKDLFSIWVEVKLFCFNVVLSLKKKTVERELKFEN